MADQIIKLSPDELNKLQAALDAPMTLEDAEDVLSEFGLMDTSTILAKDLPSWYDPPTGMFRIYWHTTTNAIHCCENADEVIALAQEELEKEIA